MSTLARKWLAQMTKMAVWAKMVKMTQKAWFSRISDFWGDFSRSFCIRRTIRAHLGALWLGLLKRGRKPSISINENVSILMFGLHVKKRTKKACFFCYSVTPPHPTAKASWGWLRVGVGMPRLVLLEFRATRNNVMATPRSYCRGCFKMVLLSNTPANRTLVSP